jgi:hypothetical protein
VGNQGSGKSQSAGAAALAAQKAKAETGAAAEKAAGAEQASASEDTIDDRAAQERLAPHLTDGPAAADADGSMPAGETHADDETVKNAGDVPNPPATSPADEPAKTDTPPGDVPPGAPGDGLPPGNQDTKDDQANPPGFQVTPEEMAAHQDDAGWLAAAEDAAQQARAEEAERQLAEDQLTIARNQAAEYLRDLEDPPVRRFLVAGHRPLTLGYPKPDGSCDYFPGDTVYEHMLEDGSGLGAARLEQLGHVVPNGTERTSKLPQYMQRKAPQANPEALPGSDLLIIATDPAAAGAAVAEAGGAGPFDPARHNVQDALAFGRALTSADDVRRLIQAEIDGKHRTTLLAQLGEHLEKIELADDAGTPETS